LSSSLKNFESLINSGNPIGEVISVNQYLIVLKGLDGIMLHSLVLFENGCKGYVKSINAHNVTVLYMGTEAVALGMNAVLLNDKLVAKVGKDYIGRVISVTGEPLDGKGPIAADAIWPVFKDAPPLHARAQLSDQLATGGYSYRFAISDSPRPAYGNIRR
jgi:F-type H+/Na+-transporting ATPase subunit alpha